MGATAVAVFADAPALLVYALAAAAATTVTLTRPAQAALVPGLARSPEELTAANVVSSWIESAGIFLAPAAAGVLLGVSGTATVFAVMAVVAAVGGLLTVGLPGPAASTEARGSAGGDRRRVPARRPGPVFADARRAARCAVRRHRRARRPLRRPGAGRARPRPIRRRLPERGVRPRRSAGRGCDRSAGGTGPPGSSAPHGRRRLDALPVGAGGVGDHDRSVRAARGRRRGTQPARRGRPDAAPANRAHRAALTRLRRARGRGHGRACARLRPRAGARRRRRCAERRCSAQARCCRSSRCSPVAVCSRPTAAPRCR